MTCAYSSTRWSTDLRYFNTTVRWSHHTLHHLIHRQHLLHRLIHLSHQAYLPYHRSDASHIHLNPASIHPHNPEPRTKPKAINPTLPFIPKFVSKPAPAKQMPASSSSPPPSNHLGVMFRAICRFTTTYRYNGIAYCRYLPKKQTVTLKQHLVTRHLFQNPLKKNNMSLEKKMMKKTMRQPERRLILMLCTLTRHNGHSLCFNCRLPSSIIPSPASVPVRLMPRGIGGRGLPPHLPSPLRTFFALLFRAEVSLRTRTLDLAASWNVH